MKKRTTKRIDPMQQIAAELAALRQHATQLLDHQVAWLRGLSEQASQQVCTVILVGPAELEDGRIREVPATFNWTGTLRRGETRIERMVTYRTVAVGAWLVSLNGALISDVRIGDMLQQLPAAQQSKGPACCIRDAIAVGMQIQFTIELPP